MKTFLIFSIILFSACTSASSARTSPLISDLYQYTVYNGEAQPADIRTAKNIPVIATYFASQQELDLDTGGTGEAPVDAGFYFVRIDFPPSKNRPQGERLIIEYLIDRAPVNIITEEFQFAQYDGNPKRVRAETNAPVPLSYSYFQSREALRAAAVLETSPQQRSEVLRGLTRVESPPKEPGVYYVTVYYQGDNNYLPAEKEIQFEIRSR